MKYQILYVDDEHYNLSGFKAAYRRDYTVHTAQSGRAALEILQEYPIDLVISDQRMPKMTGVQLLEKVRESHPEIIRMILTGYSEMQAVVDAINKGKIYYYVTKPFDVENLKMEMNKALETYSLRKQNRALEAKLLLNEERQKREKIRSQFEILKHQVNPHFLFNSMNVLASLISKNPEKALEFTNQFSNVYRKLLELKEELLISLQQEMAFVQSYLFLQKTRFDDSLQLEVNIADSALQMQLPPFALKLLVENAIKHNIVAMHQVLTINIGIENNTLIVTNNWQPRHNKIDSTKIGLKNLKARYQLMTPQPVFFGRVGDYYVAKLPLL